MKVKKEFVSSISLTNKSLLKYKYTILEGEKKGKMFYSETVTPKINEYKHGTGETEYYFDGSKLYDNAEDCINDLK